MQNDMSWTQGSRLAKRDPLTKRYLDRIRQIAIDPSTNHYSPTDAMEHIAFRQDNTFRNGYELPNRKTIRLVMQEAREKTHLVDISKGVTESLKITPFAVANWIDQRARNESPSLVGQEFKDYTDLLYQGGFPEIPPHIIRRLSEFIAKAWNEQDRNATRCYLEFIGAEPWVDEGRWIRYITTEFNEPNEAFKELVALSKPELLRDMEDQDFIAFRGNAVPLKMTSTRTFLDFTESERDDRPAPQYFDMHDIGIVNNPFEPLGNQVETMEFEEGTIDTPMLIITKKIIDAIEQYHVTR